MALLSIPALEIMTMTSKISFYDAIKTDYRRHYANMLWINMYWTALECTHVPNKMATEHKLHYTRFYKKKKKKSHHECTTTNISKFNAVGLNYLEKGPIKGATKKNNKSEDLSPNLRTLILASPQERAKQAQQTGTTFTIRLRHNTSNS